jgi:hypothetical protein
MVFLKNRRTAAAIFVLAAVLSTLIGVHFSVSREAAKVEARFMSGVFIESERYTQPGIGTHLDARINASIGLVTVAANYPALSEETEALRTARRTLLEADGIDQKYQANKVLDDACRALASALAGESPTPEDSAAAADYLSKLDGAQRAIDNSLYNAEVSKFEREVLGKFPVSVLRLLAFPDTPRYFGVEG